MRRRDFVARVTVMAAAWPSVAKFKPVLDLDTLDALGLTPPSSLLAGADEVIE